MFNHFLRLANIECALCLFILASLLVGNLTLASVFFNLTMIALLPHLLQVLKKGEERRLTFSYIITMGSAWLCSCLSLLNKHGNIEFYMLHKPMMFSIVLTAFYCMSTVKVVNTDFSFITRTGLAASGIFYLMYLIYGKGIGMGIFTLCFSNSNLCGMWVLLYILYGLVSLIYDKHVILKIYALCTLSINFAFLLWSETRNCIISLVLCITLFCLFKHKKDKPFSPAVIWIVILFPLIFAVTYLANIKIIETSDCFDFLVSEGKGIDSRVEIWERFLNKFFESPIVGCLGDFPRGMQAHNSHFDILCAFGMPTFCFCCYFLYRIFYKINQQIQSRQQFIMFISFIATTLLGMGEAALYVGAGGFYAACAVFIYLARVSEIKRI